MVLVVVLIEDVLGLQAEELSLAYSYDFDLFFVVGLVVDLVEVGCDSVELLFAVFLARMFLCLIPNFSLAMKDQEELSNEVALGVNELVVAESPARAIGHILLHLIGWDSSEGKSMAERSGQLVHFLLIDPLNRPNVGVLVEPEQQRQLLGLDRVRVVLVRLQRVGEHCLSDLKLKGLDILLLLVLSLLLPVRSNAALNDDIVVIMELAFLLHLCSLEDLEQLDIAEEIFILLLRDFALELVEVTDPSLDAKFID